MEFRLITSVCDKNHNGILFAINRIVNGDRRRPHPSGTIFGALLLAWARKVSAVRIYTWNVRHFQLVAPDLKDRITTPRATL